MQFLRLQIFVVIECEVNEPECGIKYRIENRLVLHAVPDGHGIRSRVAKDHKTYGRYQQASPIRFLNFRGTSWFEVPMGRPF